MSYNTQRRQSIVLMYTAFKNNPFLRFTFLRHLPWSASRAIETLHHYGLRINNICV